MKRNSNTISIDMTVDNGNNTKVGYMGNYYDLQKLLQLLNYIHENYNEIVFPVETMKKQSNTK